MIKTHPLPITTMVQYPPLHRPRRPELKEQLGQWWHPDKISRKKSKPRIGYIRTPTTEAIGPTVFAAQEIESIKKVINLNTEAD